MKFSAFLKRGVGRIGSQRLYRVLWVFYTELRFLPSPLTKSSAPMAPTHLKCLLFLQVPSQYPDYSLLQARNPVSQLGLGLKGRRCLSSVQLHDGHVQWSEIIPLTSPGWGCQLQNTSLSIYSGPWVSLGSAWSTLNAAEKGVIDILKASMKPPVHGCDSCNATWFSMIPELEKIRQLISLDFSNTDWSTAALLTQDNLLQCSPLLICFGPQLEGNLGQPSWIHYRN